MVIVIVLIAHDISLLGIRARIKQARAIVVVLENEMDRAPGGGGEMPDDPADIMQDRGLSRSTME